jgi:transposase
MPDTVISHAENVSKKHEKKRENKYKYLTLLVLYAIIIFMITPKAQASYSADEKDEIFAHLASVIAQKEAHIEQLTLKYEANQRQLATLQHQIEQLIRRIYGRKSEKIDPNQMMFDAIIRESLTQSVAIFDKEKAKAEAPVVAIAKFRKERTQHGRLPIPEHLERVEVIIDIPEDKKVSPLTGEPLKVISVECSEKLEYRPGKLFVKVYQRPQYALPGNEGVVCAAMPDSPIAKCKADVGLLAHVIVSKFADHLPHYRQDAIFHRERVEIPRATQSGWMMQMYESIKILVPVLTRAVQESGILFTDDTPVALQDHQNHPGKFKKARLWVYVRGGTTPPLSVYDFSIDRGKKRPLAFLAGYRGYVHADAYSGYDELFKKEGIIEIGCWAHARRKFDEAASSRPKEATDILARIARLYHEVETPGKYLKVEELYQLRQQKAKSLLDNIFEVLDDLKARTIPSEPLRKAIDYSLNQKVALCRYLENGHLKPDNNTAENAMRPVALGRKNWLFVGSERGGHAAALYMSLIQSCKNLDINPWEYFNDMLRRIMNHPVNRLRELLPDQWRPLSR